MIVDREKWDVVESDEKSRPLVLVAFPCHPSYVLRSWVMGDGRVTGRIECTAPSCGKNYEDVTLEGWSA